jgi:hypothetical protein
MKANGISSGKPSGKRWAGVAKSATAVVQRERFCFDNMQLPQLVLKGHTSIVAVSTVVGGDGQ